MKKQILKRITPIIALTVMLCIGAVCFISGSAATEYNSGDWKYTVSDGKATVTGYTGTETTLNFPTTLGEYPVDSIGYSAFKNNTKITSAIIPEGYKVIGEEAFYGCSYLKNVTIPASMRYIGSSEYYYNGSSFKNCIRLETVTFTEGGTATAAINSYSFSGCTALKSVTIPANYKTINHRAFSGCSALETLTIKENEDNLITRTIQSNAFEYCTSLGSVNIPEGFTMIGEEAFLGCSHLKSVTIPASMRYIGSSEYYYNGSSFKNCIRLETVTFTEGGTATAVINSYSFSGCTALKNVVIPANYKTISANAFTGCTSLTTVITLDNSDEYFERSIGEKAFYGCSSLTQVHISQGFTSIGKNAFSNCSTDNVICSTVSDCAAKTYADENGISFVICGAAHELPDIPDIPVVTTYTLTYDANGGSGAPAAQTGAATYTISTTIPVRDGYKFLGWAFDEIATSASCVGGANITVSADTVLYAVWEKIPNEPTTEPTEPVTQPTTEPATQPTTRPTEPTTEPTRPTTKPTEPITEPSTRKPAASVLAVSVKIKTPSQSTINYGDSIILHADTENLPEGAYIEWTVSSGNFKIVSRSVDSKNCTITPEATGADVITVTVYDEDGNEICSDSQTMTSKAGIWQKIVAFFKKLFGMTKIIPEAFKNIF